MSGRKANGKRAASDFASFPTGTQGNRCSGAAARSDVRDSGMGFAIAVSYGFRAVQQGGPAGVESRSVAARIGSRRDRSLRQTWYGALQKLGAVQEALRSHSSRGKYPIRPVGHRARRYHRKPCGAEGQQARIRGRSKTRHVRRGPSTFEQRHTFAAIPACKSLGPRMATAAVSDAGQQSAVAATAAVCPPCSGAR